MLGQILDFSIQTNSGIIRGDDGNRYQFAGSEWKDTVNPNRGMQVDFEVEGSDALGIYRAPGSAGGGTDLSSLLGSEKNRIVAGVLALVLGWVGAHKWYLGLYKPAKLQTIGGASAFILTLIIPAALSFSYFTIILAGIFGVIGWLCWTALGIIGLVEGIMYLTKSDEQFAEIYVEGRKEWF